MLFLWSFSSCHAVMQQVLYCLVVTKFLILLHCTWIFGQTTTIELSDWKIKSVNCLFVPHACGWEQHIFDVFTNILVHCCIYSSRWGKTQEITLLHHNHPTEIQQKRIDCKNVTASVKKYFWAVLPYQSCSSWGIVNKFLWQWQASWKSGEALGSSRRAVL